MSAAAPKQYLEIAARPLLYYALRAIVRHPRIERVFVVLAPGDIHFAHYDWGECGAKLAPLYCGGATRAATVLNGLLATHDVIGVSDWVMVHDAVRPCLDPVALDRLFAEVAEDDAGGLLAVPVRDTLKRANRESRVASTELRDDLWLAQTPQMFRYRVLLEGLRAADATSVTDDARAIEALGLKPKLVMGDARNIKVTYPDDLLLAEAILKAMTGATNDR
ncbi:MAG TPA: 2-C-methyl-D-erythritol 4-phosphate cytidylyltransferase [Burkholderiales bacterium]|nr:2-C-methyl-D-erythritol 4-phosphate cytidylyltransferase [Burkholderiales bacterium]